MSLPAEKLRIKAEITGKGIAGLLAMNGGAAVALGSLLQALIDKPAAHDLIPFIMSGLKWTAAGVLFAGTIFVAQYVQLLVEKFTGRFLWRNAAWLFTWALCLASLFCFARGVWLMALDASLVTRYSERAPGAPPRTPDPVRSCCAER